MAGTVIDSLIVEFGLDASKFTDGEKAIIAGQKKLEEASTKTTKSTEANAGKQALALNEVAQSALKMFAVFTAGKGLEQFARDTVKTNAALGRTSTNLNMSTDALSKWQNAFERGGGSAQGLTGTLSGLTTEIQKFQATGRSDVLPWFNRLGIDLNDSQTGKLKDNTQILLELADKLHSMPAAQANFFGSQIGIDQDTLNVLRQGRPELEHLLDTQEKIGHTTKADADAAALLQTDLRELGQASGRTGEIILTDLTPALDGMLKKLTELAEWGQQHKGIAEIILGVGGIGAFATTVSTLRKLLGLIGLGGGAGGTGAAAAAEAGGIGLGTGTAGAILAADAAIGAGGAYASTYGLRQQQAGNLRDMQAAAAEGAGGAAAALRGFNPATAGNPRGIRNNNPGNLQFAGQAGAGSDGRFATFGSMIEGLEALGKQLKRYESRGINTIRAIISKFAPPNENNTQAYIASVAGALGVDPDAPLTLDGKTLSGLKRGIIDVENGRGWSNRLLGSISPSGAGASSSSSSVNIGSINVHTQATDSQGIAKSIGPVVKSNLLATQANTGLQ